MDDREDELTLLRLRVADLERELADFRMARLCDDRRNAKDARRAEEKRIDDEIRHRSSDEASRYGGRAPPPIAPAVILDGADLIATLRTVRQLRRLRHLELDQRIGWADGYTGKVEQPHKRFGRQLVAPALSDLMAALGVGLVAVDIGPRARSAHLPLPLAIEPDSGRVEIRPYAADAETLADVRQSLSAIGINVN